MENKHINESILSEEILEDQKKNRIDHMTYLPDMQNIGSDIMDQVIDAMNAGVSCIDAGHYETERHFVPLCCNWLSEEVPSVCFLPSETMRPGFTFRTFEWKE